VLTLPGPVSPRTLFAGVESLPAGQYLRVTEDSCERRPYWDLEYPERADADRFEAPDFDDLDARLHAAVADRLQADVPVGFYLSGGLDSSLIAAMIHDVDRTNSAGRARHAFSVTFPLPEIDERRHQALMVRRLAAHHHTRSFDVDDLESRLCQMVRHAETPLKESYNGCSLVLSHLAHEHDVKVVLTGEGADELFAGYVGYRLDRQHVDDDGDLDGLLEREVRAQLWGDEEFFYEKSYLRFREVKSAVYAPRLTSALRSFDCCEQPLVDPAKLRNRHPRHQRSYVDFKLRLADHLLADHGDRVAYANSVEARYPYLDINVIDWVRHASPEWLVHEGVEKYPLRRVAARYLPPAIFKREKFAFVAPSCAVLLRKNVEWVEDLLSYEHIKRAGYFNPDTVERLKEQYRQPGFDLNTTFDLDILMFVLTFEIFRKCFSIPCL
jgi:asparagine synthase (glutamine-hydrolysing)